MAVHKGSKVRPAVHSLGHSPVQSAAVLPQSTTEVVKVTDSVPASGSSRGLSKAIVSKAFVSEPVASTPVVAKAGVTNAVGAYGERLAARYLTDAGMQILDRNWRCDQGEIDIVAMDDVCLVIVEVKTRRSLAFGSPVEAVTAVKAARLRRLAACWMSEHRSQVGSVADVRIDVVGVLRPRTGPARIEHLAAVAT
jgi:putative endonuclease